MWFPLRVTLRKELGEAFVALGIVGAALPLFESLELWDNLIVCYRLMDKKVAAEELVKRRLEATPADPRLWCALGDLTLDDAHYLKAWELSGQRSARAQRSLARNAIRLERFADAAEHWETALALSPLHNEGWFTLGWCWIKEKNYPKALTALTRSAQMDPDNGEAWNNLAAVHMHLEHWKEAYAALSEAVKQKRDSWQTWENYAAVAVKVGEWQVACRAAGQVVALSNGERVDLEVLKALVQEVERGFLGPKDAADYENSALEMRDMNGKEEDDVEGQNGGDDGGAAAAAAALATMSTSDEGMSQPSTLPSASAPGDAASEEAAAHAAATLRNLVGKLMKQVAGGAAGDSAFWGVYARYYSAIGEKDAAGECLMKRVRALQGGASSDDAAAFQAYAEACTALARAHLASGQARELSQARMLLRAALRQGKERHSEVDAYREMEEALELVEQKAAELKGA